MKKSLLAILLVSSVAVFSQEDVSETFDDTRVVNGHSVETNKEGSMKFIIAHRFGLLNGGLYQLFGLDQSTIRMGFDYGITDKITIGIGRSSFQKTIDGFVKARLLTQNTGGGSPISLTWLSTSDYNTLKSPANQEIEGKLRFSYTHQLLLAKKFGDAFSIQVMPTYLHRNLVPTKEFSNDIFSVGTAGRLRLTQMLSLKAEYYIAIPDQLSDANTNSLAVGVDIATKHHVFQLHIGNSRGMIEKFFISETYGEWSQGDIMLGFNITRNFQVKGRKYK
jgi:hypothetical protein|tara:strand:+ start:2786 stop:3619 length:834 start_codon:yes stop_codon:yes gene_type:complete